MKFHLDLNEDQRYHHIKVEVYYQKINHQWVDQLYRDFMEVLNVLLSHLQNFNDVQLDLHIQEGFHCCAIINHLKYQKYQCVMVDLYYYLNPIIVFWVFHQIQNHLHFRQYFLKNELFLINFNLYLLIKFLQCHLNYLNL